MEVDSVSCSGFDRRGKDAELHVVSHGDAVVVPARWFGFYFTVWGMRCGSVKTEKCLGSFGSEPKPIASK